MASQEALKRARELLVKMTLREKAAQLVGVQPAGLFDEHGLRSAAAERILSDGVGHISGATQFGVSKPAEIAARVNEVQRFLRERTRHGIPAIVHNEALAGVMLPSFPVFPTSIGLAATWHPELIEEMATMIGRQARAVGVTQVLAPVLDVSREARWGRVHETYGEEPYLVSEMGVAFVRGVQGSSARSGVLSAAKHFLGYAVTEAGRNMAVTRVGARELYEVYARPFEAAMREAHLAGVMNSYAEFDGEPIVASPTVLRDLLRGRLEFDGTVVSDYSAVQFLMTLQQAARTPEDAGILALQAGLDVELPSPFGYGAVLAGAVEAGKVDERLVDEAVLRVLRDKFALGLFDDPYVDTTSSTLIDVHEQGSELSMRLAVESMTLLKNEAHLLPIPQSARRIAVIGPHADDANFAFAPYSYPALVDMMRGLFAGEGTNMAGIELEPDSDMMEGFVALGNAMSPTFAIPPEEYVRQTYHARSLTEALADALPHAEVIPLPTGVTESEPTDLEAAATAARNADTVILALGGRPGWFGQNVTEGEGSDTADIALPANQVALVDAVLAANASAIAVIYAGRPFALDAVSEKLSTILWAYYPGQRAGQATAAVLLGHEAPSGKLPYSIPRRSGQTNVYSGQHFGTGYRVVGAVPKYTDIPTTPLFPFGHGLTYTEFEYSSIRPRHSVVPTDGVVEVAVDVTNAGHRTGDEVVQLYFSKPARGLTRPGQELVGFSRVRIEPGATATITFAVALSQIASLGADMALRVEAGDLDVLVGSSSADIRDRTTVQVTGEPVVHTTSSKRYLAAVTVERHPRP